MYFFLVQHIFRPFQQIEVQIFQKIQAGSSFKLIYLRKLSL